MEAWGEWSGRERTYEEAGSLMRITDATRDQIEAFMEREWTAENADRFAGAVAPPNWEWREYCLAAYDGEEIVGAAVFRVRGGVAHLKNVISSRARRSRGIGGALVDEFVRRARELGCHKLTLVTYHEDKSVRFYQRHGFVVEAVLRDDAFHVERCQMARFLEIHQNWN
jgi:GNAT superfamily N-acetyltransferase